MAVKTINGVATGSIKTVNGVAVASVKTWNGEAYPAATTYAIWDSANKDASVNLTNGDLTMTPTTGGVYRGGKSTIGVSTGKWYWEFLVDPAGASSGNDGFGGVANSSQANNNYPGSTTNSWGYYLASGSKFTNSSGTAYGASLAEGDILMIALDMTNGKVWFGKNGTWQASGDPGAGTNHAYSGLTGTLYAMFAGNGDTGVNSSVNTANFGASALTYSVPSGFNSGLYS